MLLLNSLSTIYRVFNDKMGVKLNQLAKFIECKTLIPIDHSE